MQKTEPTKDARTLAKIIESKYVLGWVLAGNKTEMLYLIQNALEYAYKQGVKDGKRI